jgi:siroheme decarboxylase
MAKPADALDVRLLDAIQTEVPLVERPFAAVADRLGTTERDVLARVAAMKSPPAAAIRQIGAIFDSKALGYQSTLVAARVDEDRLDEAAAVISRHPGVSHNYRRDHAFNLWYTLAVPPDSRFGLAGTVAALHRLSGARSTRLLPTLKLFKIGVRFDLGGGEGESTPSPSPSGLPRFSQELQDRARAAGITPADRAMVRVLQQDLPLVARPFDDWAHGADVGVAELLTAADTYRRRGQMRRFSAVLRHREVGMAANAMGVWAVPPGQEECFGATAAGFDAVSHCYLRPTYPDWPYNVFTMVHGRTREACEGVLSAIAEATGVHDCAALYSTKEYKKTRVRYFTGDTEAWEAAHAGAAVGEVTACR